MTNEMIVTGNDFPALTPDSEVAEAITANLAAGESIGLGDLTRIKVPTGGSTTWVWSDIYGEQTASELNGLLVLVQPRQTLWPTSYENSDGEMLPYLVSLDMVTGHQVGDDMGDLDAELIEAARNPDGSFDMMKLHYNEFGSGRNGGKRVRDERLLFVLRPDEPWPVLVSAPAMSLNAIRTFVKKLHVPHYRAIVSLKLEKRKSNAGQAYASIVPSVLGTVDREQGKRVLELYTDPLKREIQKSIAS